MKTQTAWRALLLSALFAARLPGTEEPAGSGAYTLFEGARLSVSQGGALYAVRDVQGGTWVVVVDGKPALVDARDGPVSMRITPAQELTQVCATLANLSGERGYTFDNDPSVRLTRELSNAASITVGAQIATSQAIAAQNGAIAATQMGLNRISAGGQNPSANPSSTLAQTLSTAQQAVTAATNNIGGDLLVRDNGEFGDFDALDISFEASSATPLRNPYIVVITRFRPRGGGGTYQLVYARSLGPLDAKPRRIRLEQAGFPPGFEALGFEVHLYEHGYELATNAAPKRQVLTAAQAFRYVKERYIDSHPGKTLPPSPAMIEVPQEIRARLEAGTRAAVFYVSVSADGTPKGVFADPSCTKKVGDSVLGEAVGAIRFKPALDRGEPVEGVAELSLGELGL